MTGTCIVLPFGQHVSHCRAVEGSSCFYYPTMNIEVVGWTTLMEKKSLVARAGRIEVSDNDSAKLHKHPGATIAFITAGSGTFRTLEGDVPVRSGDVIYIPEDTPHLSLADKDTTMIEWIVYFGEENDVQTLIEVE